MVQSQDHSPLDSRVLSDRNLSNYNQLRLLMQPFSQCQDGHTYPGLESSHLLVEPLLSCWNIAVTIMPTRKSAAIGASNWITTSPSCTHNISSYLGLSISNSTHAESSWTFTDTRI